MMLTTLTKDPMLAMLPAEPMDPTDAKLPQEPMENALFLLNALIKEFSDL